MFTYIDDPFYFPQNKDHMPQLYKTEEIYTTKAWV
jgi:hypothetical protein